uniref:ent-kaurene synthase 1, chloroplastic-like n=1 Tax=Erigeron canadensis TaxID=72917 RepID=UPI001CB996DB|nr:ent-kaurene synthase 1, chloroplastic-like [Erigeron canadensis]
MVISQSMSMARAVPSSHEADRSWGLSALPRASSHVAQANSMTLDMTKERIRKLFNNVELSVSSYDTAWVAMVPSPDSPKSPRFPECLNWLIENQLEDGSWGLFHHNQPLTKDSLSSTLACIVALKRWNVGEDQINKGLHFIDLNFASVTDKSQPSPVGFEIIFPGMLKYAKHLNIDLPLNETDLSLLLNERASQLQRCGSKEKEAYLAYISEGLGDIHYWNTVMKYQMKNGSVLNSPSATAAVLIDHQNNGCLSYLTSLLNKFGNAVPTIYPVDLYVRLSMVETLLKLGIARHFRVEIQNVLDETYRCWVQKDEQIFTDVVTCALAFRVLRISGYEVSPGLLTEITKEGIYMNAPAEPFKDIYSALEVHRASQVMYQEELTLGDKISRSSDILVGLQTIFAETVPSNIHKEVEDALKFPFNSCLERISARRNIEHYNMDNTRTLKTTYRLSNTGNQDYLRLAVEDFNACQSIYRRELESLERWVVENRLNQLEFARQRTASCYFSAVAALSSPELSDARISWAKHCILTIMVDDFFDVIGQMDELANLIQCVEKWNVNVETDCCSETVCILFLALKDAICWTGKAAFKWQGRDIASHVIQLWLDLMKSELTEVRWRNDAYMPTINEYMENAYVSFALGPILLPALYLIGPKLSEEIVQSSEYHYLFKSMSTQARLLNDIQTFKREFEQGKFNAVLLHMSQQNSGVMLEEVVEEMKTLVESQRREMIKLVLEAKGSIVPRACKDAFWNTCNSAKLFYATDDGFTGNSIQDTVKQVIYEPISHPMMSLDGGKERS